MKKGREKFKKEKVTIDTNKQMQRKRILKEGVS